MPERVARAVPGSIRDGRSNVALVAVAWVDLPTSDQARQLQQLIDRPGTGNIMELSRENGGQQFSGDYYRSTRKDTMVNAQGRTRRPRPRRDRPGEAVNPPSEGSV